MATRSKQGNDQYLIQGLQNGSESGLKAIMDEFYTPLVLYAYRITDNQAASEDIVQEALVSLWNKRNSLSEIKSLQSYLYTIVRNGSLSWMRSVKSQTLRNQAATSLIETVELPVLESLIHHEMMATIYSAMEKLPRQCKKVFTLYYVEGKKMSEIAEELKISVATAHTHKIRGIHLLQKALMGLQIWVSFIFCF